MYEQNDLKYDIFNVTINFSSSYCGFGNAFLFEQISEEDISAVEKFVREDLLDLISRNAEQSLNAENILLDDEQMVENFGELYKGCPTKFRFQPGDRKFVLLIRDHIQREIGKKGRKKAMQHFGRQIDQKKKKKHKLDDEKLDKTVSSECDVEEIRDLKLKLLTQMVEKFKSFAVPQCMIDIFDETFVKVHVSKDKKIIGDVICVVRHAESEHPEKIKPKSVFCQTKRNGLKSWVLSNFTTHFSRAHKNILNCTVEEVEVEIVNANEHDDNDESVVEISTSPIDCSDNSIEIIYDSNTNDTGNLEKLFNDQISKQTINMWKSDTLAGEHIEYKVKCNGADGKKISFDVAHISHDGDCLFTAAAHQLFMDEIGSSKHDIAARALRASVVKCIQENYVQFQFELHGHVLELKECDKTAKEYGLDEIEDTDEAAKYFLDNLLGLPSCWGGGESLKAIALLHNVNIVLFYEDGPVSLIGGLNRTSARTIAFAYRLSGAGNQHRNHYDSVCNISASDIYNTAKIISKNLNRNSNVIHIDTSP